MHSARHFDGISSKSTVLLTRRYPLAALPNCGARALRVEQRRHCQVRGEGREVSVDRAVDPPSLASEATLRKTLNTHQQKRYLLP